MELDNQARFAVLAVRLSSLTHPAVAGQFQASAWPRTIPQPVTRLLSDFLRKPQSRSRSNHPDLWPGLALPALLAATELRACALRF